MLTSLLLSLIDENDKTCWDGETFTDIESRKCESNILWTSEQENVNQIKKDYLKKLQNDQKAK